MGFALDGPVLLWYNSTLRWYAEGGPFHGKGTGSPVHGGGRQAGPAGPVRLLLARDADPQLTRALAEQAVAQGVETVWFGSRKELGHACGITVGAAAAAEL